MAKAKPPKEGTCQKCNTVHELVPRPNGKGLVLIEHDRSVDLHVVLGGGAVRFRCTGSGTKSTEESRRRAEDRELAKQRREAELVDQAPAVLDAWLDQRQSLFQSELVGQLLNIAIRRYRFRFGLRGPQLISEIAAHVVYVDRGAPPGRNTRPWGGKFEGRDAYCMFCRSLVATWAQLLACNNHRVDIMLREHTTICGLALLCGTLEPAPPTERRLPPEMRQDA